MLKDDLQKHAIAKHSHIQHGRMHNNNKCLKITNWVWRTAQRLRALTALAEDLDLMPSSHVVANN